MLPISSRTAGLLALIGAALPAAAQQAQIQELPVVTVTANKQSQALERVPTNVTSFSSSTALVVDGVATLSGLGFDDALLGIERVEVLRGPQSTLYGRNAEAGAVSIVTRRPGNEPLAATSIDLGSRDKQPLRFDASRALVQDTLYPGVAGEFARQGGFIDNTYTGRTVLSAHSDTASTKYVSSSTNPGNSVVIPALL